MLSKICCRQASRQTVKSTRPKCLIFDNNKIYTYEDLIIFVKICFDIPSKDVLLFQNII